LRKGDPLKAWPEVPVKAYVELSDREKAVLRRRQIMILAWSILGSFTYALIWYWLPSVDSFIGSQFGFGAFDIGLLISSFGGAFIVTNFLWGHLNDVYWPYRVMTVGFIVAGLSTVVFPLAHNLGEMLLLRVLEGVFNGAAWSGLIKTVQLWFPIEKRSRYLGVMIAVYSWAISADELLGPTFAVGRGGWQEWSIIVGALGLVAGVVTYIVAKPFGPMVGLPHLDWGDVPPSRDMTFTSVTKTLYKYRWMVLSILAGFVVIGGANIVSGFYFSDVLGGIQHLTLPQIITIATVWGVAQGILILIFGPLSDTTRRRVVFVKIGMGGAFLSMVGVVAATVYTHMPLSLLYLITIATGWPFLIAGPIFSLLADKYGVQMVGAAAAHFEGFGTGGGAFLLPLILGSLLPVLGPTYPWLVVALIYLAVFVAWLVQRDYVVSRSLVDVATLNKEKQEKEKEFGLLK